MSFGCLRLVAAPLVRARVSVLGEVGSRYGWESQATEVHGTKSHISPHSMLHPIAVLQMASSSSGLPSTG